MPIVWGNSRWCPLPPCDCHSTIFLPYYCNFRPYVYVGVEIPSRRGPPTTHIRCRPTMNAHIVSLLRTNSHRSTRAIRVPFMLVNASECGLLLFYYGGEQCIANAVHTARHFRHPQCTLTNPCKSKTYCSEIPFPEHDTCILVNAITATTPLLLDVC